MLNLPGGGGVRVYPRASAHPHLYPPSFPSRSMTPCSKTGQCHTSGLYEDKFLNNFHQIKLSLDSYNKLMGYFTSPLVFKISLFLEEL